MKRMRKLEIDLTEQSEAIQESLIAFLDGLPDKLITAVCQAVNGYYKRCNDETNEQIRN